MEKKRKIQLRTAEMGESILAAIIFLILGIFLITNPEKSIQWIVGIVGSVVTLVGIFRLLLYYKTKEGDKKEVLTGGLFIILGMTMIICAIAFMDEVVVNVLRITLAIYLLYVGVFRLVYAFKVKGDKKPYFINALVNIGLGVLLILLPALIDAPLVIIGILMTFYAINEIVGFVFGRKNGTGVKVEEAVIVNEKIESKEEEVKLLK